VNARSIHDMNQVILNNLYKIPKDVQVVAGVPRSGMLAALILSLHRDIAITDIDGLLASRLMLAGSRTYVNNVTSDGYLQTKRKVLVIDDSYYRGVTIKHVKQRIQEARLPHEIAYAVVYGELRAKDDIDIVLGTLLPPHVFEWNLSRNIVLENTCLDLDGVLCRNPQPYEDDDGEYYKEFITQAELLWKPIRPVGWIVTSRLEKYRNITEQWLKKNGIDYGHLIMMNVEDQAARRRTSVPDYKSAVYQSSGAALFIESALVEAIQIASRTQKKVFCFESAEFIPPSSYDTFKSQIKDPSNILNVIFLYLGFLFRKYPDNHPIIGPLRKSGRHIFRFMKSIASGKSCVSGS